MSIWPRSYGPGIPIVKATQTLPAGTTANLFTVSGTVLVQFMAGLVTTAIQNQACTLALGVTPTSGTAANTAIATATTITAATVGEFFVPVFASSVGGAAILAPAISALPGEGTQFLVPAGHITWTTSAANTGDMQFYLSYLPVDSGATVS